MLHKILLDAGRLEKLEKAVQDEVYLEKLLQEFKEENPSL